MSTSESGRPVPLRASDLAYEQIRAMILDLRLPPGEILNEQSLASSLGLGRMPVREALARLSGDRFVVVLPRRGTAVAPIGVSEVAELFEAREALECGIAHVIARKVSDAQVDHLERLITEAETARGEFDIERFLLDDLEIHQFLLNQMDHPLVRDAAERLLLHNLRLWRSFFTNRVPRSDTMVSHVNLLVALRARDAEAAEAAMREHIASSRHLLQELF
ncbi:MAG: GntR family transcriptional regulator [Actinomycetota bacterium]|nr:GntR family transcriptional regulator [Actinomycetota bacterium]